MSSELFLASELPIEPKEKKETNSIWHEKQDALYLINGISRSIYSRPHIRFGRQGLHELDLLDSYSPRLNELKFLAGQEYALKVYFQDIDNITSEHLKIFEFLGRKEVASEFPRYLLSAGLRNIGDKWEHVYQYHSIDPHFACGTQYTFLRLHLAQYKQPEGKDFDFQELFNQKQEKLLDRTLPWKYLNPLLEPANSYYQLTDNFTVNPIPTNETVWRSDSPHVHNLKTKSEREKGLIKTFNTRGELHRVNPKPDWYFRWDFQPPIVDARIGKTEEITFAPGQAVLNFPAVSLKINHNRKKQYKQIALVSREVNDGCLRASKHTFSERGRLISTEIPEWVFPKKQNSEVITTLEKGGLLSIPPNPQSLDFDDIWNFMVDQSQQNIGKGYTRSSTKRIIEGILDHVKY